MASSTHSLQLYAEYKPNELNDYGAFAHILIWYTFNIQNIVGVQRKSRIVIWPIKKLGSISFKFSYIFCSEKYNRFPRIRANVLILGDPN